MKKNGFTLIELILYVGVIAIVLGAMIPFAWNMIGSGAKSSVEQDVYANARYISERIKYEIRRASGVINVSANSLTLDNFLPDSTTVIDLNNGHVRINKNASGPVNLSSEGVIVSKLDFNNNSSNDGKTDNI